MSVRRRLLLFLSLFLLFSFLVIVSNTEAALKKVEASKEWNEVAIIKSSHPGTFHPLSSVSVRRRWKKTISYRN